MDKNSILQADVLDIIFEGRNKEYGAYELRQTYNRRLRISVAVMTLVVLSLSITQLLAGRGKPSDTLTMLLPPDAHIEDIKPVEEQPLLPPPPPPPPPPQRVQTIQYSTPLIVDEEVPEAPPEIDALESAVIDVANQDGREDDGVVDPPLEDVGRDIVVAPKVEEENANTPFMKVEVESEFPGGRAAWERFLRRYLRYPQEAIDNAKEGIVVVQFVVDTLGNVSEVKAISGPEEFRTEAERVIKKSGKWTPARQNGRHVPSYKKQQIVFALTRG